MKGTIYKIFGLVFLVMAMGCEGKFDVDPLATIEINLIAPADSELCDVRILESGDYSVRFEWAILGQYNETFTLTYTNTVTGVSETALAQGGQTSVDVTLEPGIRYSWTVTAIFNGDTVQANQGNFITVTPGLQDTSHPPYLSDIAVQEQGGNSYQLDYLAIDPDQDAIVYDVFVDTQNPPLNQEESNSPQAGTVVSMNPSSTYFIRVVAKDGTGNETTSSRSYTTQ